MDDLIASMTGSDLVVHGAARDVAFLDHELRAAGRPSVSDTCRIVIDTWAFARSRYLGHRNTLSALCERLEIDDAPYLSMAPALMDAHCLAEVFGRMAHARTRGLSRWPSRCLTGEAPR